MTSSSAKTDAGLIRRLETAAKRTLSKDELHRQRVSFVYGNLPNDSTVTRHQVEAVLGKSEGEAA